LISFDFVIIYRLDILEEKFDALSRRLNYQFSIINNVSEKFNEFKFLKPHQFINFLENTKRIAIITQLSLSTIIIQSLDLDIEFINKIKVVLSMNLNIDLYITNLQDSTLSREENVQLYLKSYIICEDLIVREGLIYISNDDELKFQVLHSCHDSPVSSHLEQDKTLELISCNYY